METIESLESRRLFSTLGGEFFGTSAGELDPRFGNANGIELPTREDRTVDRAMYQSDGKIVVVGHVGHYIQASQEVLWRFNADGALDTTFGVRGIVHLEPVHNEAIRINAAAIDPAGRILVAGQLGIDQSEGVFISRFTRDGRPDPSFNGIGTVSEHSVLLDSGFSNDGMSLGVAPDGKIMLAGNYHTRTNPQPAVLRVNDNGTFDHSFGDRGLSIGQALTSVQSAIVNQDGTISLFAANQDSTQLIHVARDGSFDSSATLDLGDGVRGDWCEADALPDGRFALLIRRIISASGESSLVQGVRVFDSDGSLDTSFADGGEFDAPLTRQELIGDPKLRVRADGSMLLDSGEYTISGNMYDDLLSIRADGSPDLGFSSNAGQMTLAMASRAEWLSAISDTGSVLIAGTLNSGPDDAVLQQVDARGRPDRSFGRVGTATPASTPTFSGNFQAVATQADGKILAGGVDLSGRAFVARFNPDGSLDTTFASGAGFTVFASGLDPISYEKIIPQSDGGFIAAVSSCIASFNADGTLDQHFGKRGILSRSSTDIAVNASGQIYGVYYGEIFIAPPNGDPAATHDLRGLKLPFSASQMHAIEVMSDGRIVVGGSAQPGSPDRDGAGSPFIARLLADGRTDRSFGRGYIYLDQFDEADWPYVRQLAVRPSGQVVALIRNDSDQHNGIIQINDNGQIDQTFGALGNGAIPLQFNAGPSAKYWSYSPMTFKIDSDGRILVATGAVGEDGIQRASFVRYNVGGTMDSTFGDFGISEVSFPYRGGISQSSVFAIDFSADNELIAVGTSDIERSPAIAKIFYNDTIIDPGP